MTVQIYSMTSIADAAATAEAGADLIGVVMAEPGIVPEGIGAGAAREVLAAIRPRSRGVALVGRPQRDLHDGLRRAPRILKAYPGYYNEVRTHISLGKDAPFPRTAQSFGQITALLLLGGLHRQYVRI